MVIFTPGYNKAKEQVLTNPTLENWQSFEAERNALPSLFPNQDFHNLEALRAAGERANDFAVVTHQVVHHLSPDEIQQSAALMLAYAEFSHQ